MKVGIIGMGDMGKIFAAGLAKRGFSVVGSDLPEKVECIEKEFVKCNVTITSDSITVAKNSDVLLFAVETENLEKVVKSVSQNISSKTITGGLTSTKVPEVNIFEKYLSKETPIVTCHPMHGPGIKTKGQPAALITHRANVDDKTKIKDILDALEYRIIDIPNALEHDRMTADIQAVTHIGFQGMGTAWMRAGIFPWINETYKEGLDTTKYLMMLRIFSGKPHVYSGIAFHNPEAHSQIIQYEKSCKKILNLMQKGNDADLRKILRNIQDNIFQGDNDPVITMTEPELEQFGFYERREQRLENSHLSLLAMADTWNSLGINPYKHMVCKTPPFRLRLGIIEKLFRDDCALENAIKAATSNPFVLEHDRIFVNSIENWATIINNKDSQAYEKLFLETKSFFESHLETGKNKSNDLIKYIGN